MSNQDQIQFCALTSCESVESLLKEVFHISKNQLKKQKLSKNFLTKKVLEKDELSLSLNLLNYGKINPTYKGQKPKVIFEDDKLLALSKPSGIHCHPLTYLEHDNLLSFLTAEGHVEPLRVNSNEYDRGLMYRLDRETSGLVIFIKNDEDYSHLRANFQDLVKEKIYYAVVMGEYKGDIDLQTLLKTSGKKGKKIVEDEALNAETKFSRLEILEQNYSVENDQTLLKIKLFHGHRHQIRAQLRAAGYPIKGDTLYNGKPAARLYLHCLEYKFQLGDKEYDLKDEDVEFLSEFFNLNR